MSSYRLSVIFEGRRRSVETSSEEFDFFSLLIGGKKISQNAGQLELEGPVRVSAQGVAPNDVATVGQVQFVQNLSNDNALDIIELAEDIEAVRLLTAQNAGELVRIECELEYLQSNRPVDQTIAAGVGGQTVFTFSNLTWEDDNTIPDVTVFVETDFQRIDKAGGISEAYRKLADNQIEFSETIPEGVSVTAKLSGPKFITPIPVNPFFRNDLSGISVEEYPVGGIFDIGTGKLQAYRDGLMLANSPIIGGPVDRYIEKGKTEVELGLVTLNSSIMSFFHLEDDPDYRISVSGFAGTVLTIPTHVVDDGRLRVFRGGALLNTSGFGTVFERYTDTSTTTIVFDSVVFPDEVITVEYLGAAPAWVEDISGITGTLLSFTGGNVYVPNDKKLVLHKNGVLMLDVDVGLGVAPELYNETGTGSVTLSQAAVATDVFTALYLG